MAVLINNQQVNAYIKLDGKTLSNPVWLANVLYIALISKRPNKVSNSMGNNLCFKFLHRLKPKGPTLQFYNVELHI